MKNTNKASNNQATVFDVAQYILNKIGRTTTMKLQKLVYYAQAWSLAWDDAPLFNEKIEAWANGPVVPSLYHAHKGKYFITASDLSDNISDNIQFSDESIETLDIVIKTYARLSSFQLVELTHDQNPWKEARAGCPVGEPCTNEISHSSMAEYYSSIN